MITEQKPREMPTLLALKMEKGPTPGAGRERTLEEKGVCVNTGTYP